MLARQILTAFLAVMVPGTLLLGAVTLYSLRSLGQVTRQLAEITQSLEATQDVERTIAEAQRVLAQHGRSGEPLHRAQFDRLMRAAQRQVAGCALSSCHGTSKTPREMAAVLGPAIARLAVDGHGLFDPPGGDDPRGRAPVQALHRSIAAVSEPLARMSTALLARVEHLGQQAHVVSQRALYTGAGLTALIVLLGSAVALHRARRIARPLGELLLGIRRAMAGDLTQPVSVDAKGEIGEVGGAFNAMVEEVRVHREEREEYSRLLERRVRERTEELKRKDAALVQSEKLASLGLLAAGVAHELNNPLTSIVMNANLLAEEVGPASALHAELKKIDADAARCQRIIDDLRAFARHRELCAAPSRIDHVVDQALRSSEHELQRRRIEVDTDVPPELPRIVWDADRMVQALTNLFVNAAQATAPGGRVGVHCRRDDGWLRLEVRDTGTGIPADDLCRIFDPFFTTKREGTGLGLSIVHGIVHEHGGRIEVESRPRGEAPAHDTGTTVRILVPWGEAPP